MMMVMFCYFEVLSQRFFFFFFKKFTFFYLFIYLWLCWVFVSVRGLSPIAASGDHSSSRCAGLSPPRPLAAEHRLQVRRLSNCGSWAQLLRDMWDLPRPGPEPVSPALAGRLSTTAPPGKPSAFVFLRGFHAGNWAKTSVAFLKSRVGNKHQQKCDCFHRLCCINLEK